MGDEEPTSPQTVALVHLVALCRGLEYIGDPQFPKASLEFHISAIVEAVHIYDRVMEAIKRGDTVDAEAATAAIAMDEILGIEEDGGWNEDGSWRDE